MLTGVLEIPSQAQTGAHRCMRMRAPPRTCTCTACAPYCVAQVHAHAGPPWHVHTSMHCLRTVLCGPA